MSTTLPGKDNWHLHALAVAIQDPHKNVLVVFGKHEIAKRSFQMAIDELVKNLPDYPCQMNYQQLVLTMAEGGRIHFMTMNQTSDGDRIGGYRFSTAIFDESWELVKNENVRDYIKARVAAYIR
jgi:hypothetical protein